MSKKIYKEGFCQDSKGNMYYQTTDGVRHLDWYERFIRAWTADKKFAEEMSPKIGFAREHQALKDRMQEAADNGFEVFSYPRYLELVKEMRIKWGVPEEAEKNNVVTFK